MPKKSTAMKSKWIQDPLFDVPKSSGATAAACDPVRVEVDRMALGSKLGLNHELHVSAEMTKPEVLVSCRVNIFEKNTDDVIRETKLRLKAALEKQSFLDGRYGRA